ncbi:TPA: hypothetical protein KQG29_002443 [Clostridioides difficile]|nr:hypothetical protein [Clostridioides difficile]
MKKIKILKLPCNLKHYSDKKKLEELNSNLLPVYIYVMHEGKNPNGTKFYEEAIDKAEPTLKNVPILGYVKINEDGKYDFDGHNVLTQVVQTDEGFILEEYYEERIIGVIPETNKYEKVEIDGQKYVKCKGYIYKSYSNHAYDIIMDSDEIEISMEIDINDYQLDDSDGFYNIKDYVYHGITCLGSDVKGAMGSNCCLTKFSRKINYKEEISKICSEIYALEHGEGEKNLPNKNQKLNKNSEGYALAVSNLSTEIRNKLKEYKVETENWYGEKVEVQAFYYNDLIPEENIAIVEDEINWGYYYGIPYIVNEDAVILDYENKKSYIQTWREKQEGEIVQVFSRQEKLRKEIIEKFTEKQKEISNLKASLEPLQAFKEEKEFELFKSKVDDVAQKFELAEDEIKDIKIKAYNKEITLDEYKKELGYIFALKTLSNKQSEKENFSINDDKNNTIKIPISNNNDSFSEPEEISFIKKYSDKE